MPLHVMWPGHPAAPLQSLLRYWALLLLPTQLIALLTAGMVQKWGVLARQYMGNATLLLHKGMLSACRTGLSLAAPGNSSQLWSPAAGCPRLRPLVVVVAVAVMGASVAHQYQVVRCSGEFLHGH